MSDVLTTELTLVARTSGDVSAAMLVFEGICSNKEELAGMLDCVRVSDFLSGNEDGATAIVGDRFDLAAIPTIVDSWSAAEDRVVAFKADGDDVVIATDAKVVGRIAALSLATLVPEQSAILLEELSLEITSGLELGSSKATGVASQCETACSIGIMADNA